MPVPLTGNVGYTNVSNADSSQPIAAMGKYGEFLGAELHGKYYTHNYRGKLFYASQAIAGVAITTVGTTAGFACFNPIGSGVNMVLIRFEAWIQTLPVTPIVGAYSLYVNTTLQAAGVTGSTALTVQPGFLGSGGQSRCIAFTTATLPATPTHFRSVTQKQTGATGTFPFMPVIGLDFDGTAVLAPNTAISFHQDAADNTAAKSVCTMIWYEAPV